MHDFKVTGNIEGALKDANGFKYENVKRGTIANSGTFSNIKIKLYSIGDCEIKMSYIETATNDILAGGLSKTITQSLPFVLDNLYDIIFVDNGELLFAISAIKNNSSNISSLQMKYRNITSTPQSLSSYESSVIIYAKVTESTLQNITWD